eukprot:CAMPEP_0175113900 /NCGR_PEP_ID=MMETSP0086_2-20121207/16470_1 /TAXON_ID=136419 /ORGANISM="Unknown Unknown, Strain D1" /LENGTH=560 /DNA_ID=CAMNT_0016393315 /DNA_START=197 /DNA_END=1879 /DNA_ORIENTATION=-
MRRMSRFQKQNEELMQGYQLEQKAREEELRRNMSEQNQQLSAALFDIKAQKLAEDTNVRRICEESEELKELHSRLRAAKISKIRAIQLAEKDALQQKATAQEAALDAMMERHRQDKFKRDDIEAKQKFDLNMQSKQILQDQIASRQQRKKEAYESFLKEKAMVDEIVAGIEQEDRHKQEALLAKQKELQDNIRNFLEDRRSWREAEKRKTEEELRRIEEYNLIQEERHRELSAKKQKAADEQDEVLRKLTKEIEGKRREEEEMRMLLDELYQEEAEQKGYEKEQREIEKRRQMKLDMIAANEYQKAVKLKVAEEQAIEEEKFRQQMMKKFEEDTRLEQMNAMRRRREMENYKKEVERLVEERRKVFEASVQAELQEMRQKQEQENYRQSVVERERARLLAEYASDLQDHLPKGVLRNDHDFEVVYGRAPEFDEDKEERDLIASRNTGIAVGNSSKGKDRSDSRTSQGRRSSRQYDYDYDDRQASTSEGRSRPVSQQNRRPVSQQNRRQNPASPKNEFSVNSDFFNGTGVGSRAGSRAGSRNGRSRNGSYADQKGPVDRPF